MAARAPRVVGEPPWGWALAGALAGLVFACIAFAPARWLAAGVARMTEQRVVLSEPRGTLWEGSAQVVLTGGPGSSDTAALPGRAAWTLAPRLDGLAGLLRAECCTPRPIGLRMHWRPGGMRVEVGDGVSQWPANVLAGLGTPWNTLQIEGDLRMTTQGLSVEWSAGRPAIAGRAELEALRVASRLSTLRPMGSYRITVQGGAPATLRLDTLDGSLRLTGSGQWVGSRLHFNGEATAAPDREAALANLLNIIGRRSGARSIITIG
jgi:general secretion pathway protein N